MSYRLRNIGIALVLAVVAAVLVGYYVTNYRKDVQKQEQTVSVFVASKDIPAGTPGEDVVVGQYLTQASVARKNVVPGAISSPDQVKELVATDQIFAGEQVTVNRFRPVEDQGFRAQLSGNMRAFQVPGDANQLLVGTLRAGDHVDVVTSIKYTVGDLSTDAGTADGSTESAGGGSIAGPRKRGTNGQGITSRQATEDPTATEPTFRPAPTSFAERRERVASRVVLRDLVVLKAAEAPKATSKVTDGPTGDDSSVILAVTDSQAQKLFFVLQNGDWSLQLRPATDPADSPESLETLESVLGDGLGPDQYLQLLGERNVDGDQ